MSTNMRNPAIRRIMADVRELRLHPSSRYCAAPLEDNPFEWHFTIRGPEDTDFAGGVYHGRILLPAEYPMKPPNFVFLTKNGRFEVGTKICLSISAYHEESWQPAWGVRTMLEAIISFLPSEGAGAVGALDYTPAERKKLALESQCYYCSVCGDVKALLPVLSEGETERVDKTMAQQVAQLRISRPLLSETSSRLTTSGVLDDLPSHHTAGAHSSMHSVQSVAQTAVNGLAELAPPDMSSAADAANANANVNVNTDVVTENMLHAVNAMNTVQGSLDTQALGGAENTLLEEMASLAVDRIENDRDADGTLADLLDVDVLGRARARQSKTPIVSNDNDNIAPQSELRHRRSAEENAHVNANEIAARVAAAPPSTEAIPAPSAPSPAARANIAARPAAAAAPPVQAIAPAQGSLLLSILDLLIALTISGILYVGSTVAARNK